MVCEPLAPGVEDGKEADLSSEVLGIAGDLKQRLARSPKEKPVENRLVLESEGAEVLRDCEDHVEVRGIEELGGALAEPVCPGCALARRTMPVAAGIVEALLVPAVIAAGFVPSKRGGLTGDHVLEDTSLLARGRVSSQVLRREEPEDLGESGPRWPHESHDGFHEIGAALRDLRRVERDVQVHRRRVQRAVAQDDLDRPEVRSALKEESRETVAERVGGDALREASSLSGQSAPTHGSVPRERPAGPDPLEKPDLRSQGSPVVPQDLEQRRRKGHVAVLSTFALTDPNDHARAVNIGGQELAAFADAEPRGIQRAEKRTLLGPAGSPEERADFLAAENHRKVPLLFGERDEPVFRPRPPKRGLVEESQGADVLDEHRPTALRVQ